ncbi:MAG TPA: hypothetical protein VNQ78_11420 [Paracoccus sp. (in: a-proteobacteria)]|uniref:hypothetical protein n=1 Tax=Paracoccus sp. TaxID=267 RepID=UPI002D13954F|nr:hypothetical protein [Paracoccus sp. (in: a-proteobacteria)]HWL57263.1 hypothetical protein [Paracoccus sp. (in: a-proteobacteria)]
MIIQSAPAITQANTLQSPAVSEGLEKAFLTEMLKYAGSKPLGGEFGGGIGEDQMSSLLTEIHATALARRIDLGFAA